jgi:hypothetical protein
LPERRGKPAEGLDGGRKQEGSMQKSSVNRDTLCLFVKYYQVFFKNTIFRGTLNNIPSIMTLNDKQIKYLKLWMHFGDIKIDKELLLDVLNKFRPSQYHKAATKPRYVK